jgi:Peptidase family M48
MAPRKLAGLRPQTYEHPGDKAALDVLSHNAGLNVVIRQVNAWGMDRLLRVQLTGSYLHVTKDSFPDLYGYLTTACDILDLPSIPDLYIAGGREIHAFTAGVDRPLIVLNAGAIELLTPEELLFVIAREVGHIKSCHVLYSQVANMIPYVGDIVGAIPAIGPLIGGLVTAGTGVALVKWKQLSELTADRAGLLGCQNAETALQTLMKFAGLPAKYFRAINTEDFIAQAKEFEEMDSDKLTLVSKWFRAIGETHPWTVMRAQELLRWVESHQYEEVLKNPTLLPCSNPKCQFILQATDKFCPKCGKAVPRH